MEAGSWKSREIIDPNARCLDHAVAEIRCMASVDHLQRSRRVEQPKVVIEDVEEFQ